MKPKAIIISGYFNPIRKGKIVHINNDKACGDKRIVVVNSDHQRFERFKRVSER